MQAGDAGSSWAPDLTPILGLRFFSCGGGFCLFALVPVFSPRFCMPSVYDFLNCRFCTVYKEFGHCPYLSFLSFGTEFNMIELLVRVWIQWAEREHTFCSSKSLSCILLVIEICDHV